MSAILNVRDRSGNQYNVKRASAVDQKSLLLIIGGPYAAIRERYSKVKGAREVILAEDTLVGFLMAMDETKFNRVCELTTKGMKLHGDTSGVGIDIDHFQNNMISYFSIVAQLVRGNLDDFFTWLTADLVGEPEPSTSNPSKPQKTTE